MKPRSNAAQDIPEREAAEGAACADDRAAALPNPSYILSDLLADTTPEAMRAAFEWGPDVGREVVED